MSVSSNDEYFPTLLEIFLNQLKVSKRKTIGWLARRPKLAVLVVFIFIVVSLPAVMVLALTPFAFLFNFLGGFATPSGILSIYGILLKGFLIAVLIVATVMGVFFILTCAGLLKNYNRVPQKPKKKKM